MTDFLGRVAARAVGATAVAQPRVPGLFEPADTAADAMLEVIDQEVVAPSPPTPRVERHVRAASRADTPAPRVEGPPAQLSRRARPSAADGQSQPPERVDTVAQSNDVPAAALHARPPEPPPDRVPAARGEPSVRAPVVAAAPLAQALPARSAGAPSNSLSLGGVAPVSNEPPPVRVHIGRLEVRANLQPDAPEPPRRERGRDDGLTLADYLRGKRQVSA